MAAAFVMLKTGPIHLVLVGLMAGSQAIDLKHIASQKHVPAKPTL